MASQTPTLLCLVLLHALLLPSTQAYTSTFTKVFYGSGNFTLTAPSAGEGLQLLSNAAVTHRIWVNSAEVDASVYQDVDGTTTYTAGLTLPSCKIVPGEDILVQVGCVDSELTGFCSTSTAYTFEFTSTFYEETLGTVSTTDTKWYTVNSASCTTLNGDSVPQYLHFEVTTPSSLPDGTNFLIVTVQNTKASSQQVIGASPDLIGLAIVPPDQVGSCPTFKNISSVASVVTGSHGAVQNSYSWAVPQNGGSKTDTLSPQSTYHIYIDPGLTVKDLDISIFSQNVQEDSSGVSTWVAVLLTFLGIGIGILIGFFLTIAGIVGIREVNKKKAEQFDSEFGLGDFK